MVNFVEQELEGAPSRSPDWRSWNLYQWSEVLLDHYFRRSEGNDDEPVSSLVVVGEELARAAGDPSADPDEVEAALIEKVIRGAREKGLWAHARDRVRMAKPDYLAHLVVGCLAATDLEHQDDNRYIERLANLTGPARGDLNLEEIPKLWASLVDWLSENADQYRQLVLPDPGGWTRIGYTVKLSFPSRSDQRALGRLLNTEGLVEPDPPLAPVLHAIESAARGAFTERFRAEFDDFKLRRSQGTPLPVLRSSPFWSAIRAATTVEARLPGGEAFSDCALIATDDGFDVEFWIACDQGVRVAGVETIAADDPLGSWTHVMVIDGNPEDAVASLLRSELNLPRLTSQSRGGLIPFTVERHGALESASRAQLDESESALVTDHLVDIVRNRFGSLRTKTRSSGFPGWSFLTDVRVHTLPAEELHGTELERCSILFEALLPAVIRVAGGVKVGSSWLGEQGLLPRIRAAGASSVTASQNGDTLELVPDRDGDWRFPSRHLDGEVIVEACFPDQAKDRTIRFDPAPSHENFKQRSDPLSWIFEHQARARSLNERLASPEVVPAIPDASDVILLGRDVGSFPLDRAAAAWAIETIGSRRSLRAVAPTNELDPTAMSPNPGSRRKWRKLLGKSGLEGDDREVRSLLITAIRSEDLPVRDLEDAPPMPPDTNPARHRNLDRVVEALVAIANSRVGFDRREFTELAARLLDTDFLGAQRILRAWQEAELVDDLVKVNWSGRKLSAVQPFLAAFQVDQEFRGTLRGLALPTTISELESIATESGIETSVVPACSPFVPESLVLHASSMSKLEQIAAAARLRIANLELNAFATFESRDLLSRHPVVGGYHVEGEESHSPGPKMQRRWRVKAPSFWTVALGGFSAWSYFREASRFWAQAMAGEIGVDEVGDRDIAVSGCYLPLASARWLSSLGGGNSGPLSAAPDADYRYRAPSRALRTRFLSGLQEFARDTLPQLHGGPRETQTHD